MQIKKIGIIGLDAMHAVELTKVINTAKQGVNSEFRVIAAFPNGSKNLAYRIAKVPEYSRQVQELGVAIVGSIEELLKLVDFILLTSNDGFVHLEQAIPVIEAKKPVFIDKPLAGNWKDSLTIFETSERNNVPVFSSSGLRFIPSIQELKAGSFGEILGAHTFSPAQFEPNLPELLWYGIHGIEMLFAILGSGCKYVKREATDSYDFLVSEWEDGRVGTYRGNRKGKSEFGGIVFGEKENRLLGTFAGYEPLAAAILSFFSSGIPPVTLKETLEIISYTIAADESKFKFGGKIMLPKL